MNLTKIYKHHRYSPDIISHCVWLYYRFSLSYRDIELILHQKGIIVAYESICYWCIKFGKFFAQKLRKTKTRGEW